MKSRKNNWEDSSPSSTSLFTYVGRFAPSPSGPLHLGSLIAALASYLDAKANNGLWYVRIEDLDPPRESKEAAADILHTLESLGLHWDGPILYQSQRQDAYEEGLEQLNQQGLIFPCTCTRPEIQRHGGIYQGTCRHKKIADNNNSLPFSLRCRVTPSTFNLDDQFQGKQSQNISDVGDFIVKRKDKLFAYQLAVVIDDAFQNISHIIRGIDLLESTGRQIYLQQLLNLPTPQYGHIPIIINSDGQKLSKQRFAKAININKPSQALVTALQYLQQKPDPQLELCSPSELISWAIQHWQPNKLSGLKRLPYP